MLTRYKYASPVWHSTLAVSVTKTVNIDEATEDYTTLERMGLCSVITWVYCLVLLYGLNMQWQYEIEEQELPQVCRAHARSSTQTVEHTDCGAHRRSSVVEACILGRVVVVESSAVQVHGHEYIFNRDHALAKRFYWR